MPVRRLESLGARSLAHRRGRSVLTSLGIVLGVAILFGVLSTNASVSKGLDDSIRRFTDRVDVVLRPVGAFDAVLPIAAVDSTRRLPGVEEVSPSLYLGASTPDPEKTDEPAYLAVIGVDPAAWMPMFDNEIKAGRMFTSGAGEVIVGPQVARRLKLSVGGRIHLTTPRGNEEFTVTGFVGAREAARAGGELVVFTSIDTARAVSGKGAVFTGASVVLAEGTDIGTWLDAHEGALGPGVQLERSGTGDDGFRPFLATVQASLTFIAAIALFVGAFLIYLTLSMAVIERTRMYGALRALGATRRQVRRVVVSEALVLGAVSTVLGLVLGTAIAWALLQVVTGLLEIDRDVPLAISPGAVMIAVVAGILVTLVSSLVPARRAARLSPVVAMKGDHAADARLGRAWIVGAVALPVGMALGFGGRSIGALALGTFVILLGAVLLVPTILRPLARGLGGITRRATPGVGAVAVMHLVKERSRSAYTLALVMVVLAMVFSIGAGNVAMGRSLDTFADRQFGADLSVGSANSFSPALEKAVLDDTPAVVESTALRFGQTVMQEPSPADERQVNLLILDPASYFEVLSFVWADGDDSSARKALTANGAVLLPEGLARSLDRRVGDRVTIRTAKGPRPFRVAGLYSGFGGQQGVVVGLTDGRELFNAGPPNLLALDLVAGADVEAVKRDVERRAGALDKVFVETAAEGKAEAQAQLNGFFRVFYAILFVAAVIGMLGLTNTLAMSVLQRYREIGVLRAIGTQRRQIRGMVTVEAVTLVLVALALSLPVGSLLSLIFVNTSARVLGFSVDYVYPWVWVPIVAVLGVVIAALAAIGPARRAARLQVVTALAFE
ncbi:MAG TPA: FtsX-like permease family protein [Acidimicrobiales bacterium]|nr:FtsX-like permease family protein [Acidimicrobiales bacterium]